MKILNEARMINVLALDSGRVICLPCLPGQKAVPKKGVAPPKPSVGCKLPGLPGQLPILFKVKI